VEENKPPLQQQQQQQLLLLQGPVLPRSTATNLTTECLVVQPANSSAAIMAYFSEKPGKSCSQIKVIEGDRAVSGKYWLNATGSIFQVRIISGAVYPICFHASDNRP